MTKELKNDILYWISIGWSYQIVHKMTYFKHGYDLAKGEWKTIIAETAMANAQKVASN